MTLPPSPADEPAAQPEPADSRHKEHWLKRLKAVLRLARGPSIRDDLEDALEEAGPAAGFSPQEQAMLKNVLSFRRLRVSDVMVPRVDIVAVPSEISLGELLKTFRDGAHSRLPVYGETLDDPRGMVHIRDVLAHIVGKAEREGKGSEPAGHDLAAVDLTQPLAAAKLLRAVLFVPPSMPAIDLLRKMQATRTHMALVIDEYGGTDGLVSIEDLVETIVGDIEDEHDEEAAAAIVDEGAGVFVADARASLDDVSHAIGVDLSAGAAAEEIETIGGLIVTLAGRVPVRGEIVAGPGELEFEILEADPRRIARVRIHPRRSLGELRRRRARVRGPAERETEAANPPPSETSAPEAPPPSSQR